MSKARVLAIVVLLALVLVLYEFSIVWKYPTSVIRIQQLYSIKHYHRFKSPSPLKSNPNVIHISHRNSSQSMFVARQNSSDAPLDINCRNATRISRNLKEFYRNYEDAFSDTSRETIGTAHTTITPKLEEDTGFLCINESELWAHIVKKGSVSNLTDIQQRSALARAIVEHLQVDNGDSDEVEVEEWAKDIESRHDHQQHLSSLQTLATPGMDQRWPRKGTLDVNVRLSETTGNAHENLVTQRTPLFKPIPSKKEDKDTKDFGVNYLHELRQHSDQLYGQVMQSLSRFLPDGEDHHKSDEQQQQAGVEMRGKTDRGGEVMDAELIQLLKDVPQDKLHTKPLGQGSPRNLPKEDLPQHSLPQEQYELPSDPPKNWPLHAPENFLHSIHNRNHQSLGMAKAVPDYYHVEQPDTVDMQRRQENFKYVEFGDHIDTAQGRRVTPGPTEAAGHSDQGRYPIRASVRNGGGRMEPSKQAIRVAPKKRRPWLKKMPIIHNTTGLSREKVSMAYTRLSEQLLQLRGFTVAANKDLVTGRHFPPWKNSSEVAGHLEALRQAVNGTELSRRVWTQYSLNGDIGARSKFQQAQVQQFCSMHHISNRLPSTPNDLDALFQHLLYDDAKRLIYCYVPKVGCSNMKRMMMILNGILPPESIKSRPPEAQLKQVHSFRNLSTSEALHKLNNYYKFAIVRNPMERMLSAYRNKIETPLNNSNHHFPDKMKGYILRRFRKVEYWKWVEAGNESVDIHPTFAEFLRFLLLYPLSYYNEHFKPVLNICFPCAIHYDFYANFKSQDYDVYALMDYLEIPSAYYPQNVSRKDKPTRSYLQEYFQTLPADLKDEIIQAFKTELEFYYSLYPEERNMHVLL